MRINCPGSWHDSRVARPLYDLLLESTPPGYHVITDTAFAHGVENVHGHVRTPLKENQHPPPGTAPYYRQLVSCRQSVEWGMRALQSTFARIRMPLDGNDEQSRAWILEIVARLHNLRTHRIGVNQIYSVYAPALQDEREEAWIWDGFDGMMHGELRRNDRVARFHHVPADA